MSRVIEIVDDGDEVVIFLVDGSEVGFVDHDGYGWAGMEAVISIVKRIAVAFDIEVIDRQDIV